MRRAQLYLASCTWGCTENLSSAWLWTGDYRVYDPWKSG